MDTELEERDVEIDTRTLEVTVRVAREDLEIEN